MVLGHSWEWWLTAGGPGIGGIASLILVLYYARLFRENKEQTKATRASYAPSIDAQVEYGEDDLDLTLVNRGQGVATNIMFAIEVTVNDETTGFLADIQTTLRPGKVLKYNSENQTAHLTPIVYNVYQDTSPDLIPISELFEEANSAYIEVTLRYTDIIEQEEYTDTLLQKGVNLRGRSDLNKVFGPGVRAGLAVSGPERVTLFGPSHIPFDERVGYVKERYAHWARSKKPEFLRDDYDIGKLYVGLAHRYRVEGEAVDYTGEGNDEGERPIQRAS